jgi:hypothetical protein
MLTDIAKDENISKIAQHENHKVHVVPHADW